MAGAPIIEIREPGRPVRRVVLDRAIEVGRECDGEVLSDEGVSRRHLRLVPSPVALSVVDLGSRNGTLLNGVPITGRAVLEPGAVVRLGSTEIIMIGRADRVEPAVVHRTLRAGEAAALVMPPPPAAPEVPRPPSTMSRFWAQVLGTALQLGIALRDIAEGDEQQGDGTSAGADQRAGREDEGQERGFGPMHGDGDAEHFAQDSQQKECRDNGYGDRMLLAVPGQVGHEQDQDDARDQIA